MLILHEPAFNDRTPPVEVVQNLDDDGFTRTVTRDVDATVIFASFARDTRDFTAPTLMVVIVTGTGAGFQFTTGGVHAAGAVCGGLLMDPGGTVLGGRVGFEGGVGFGGVGGAT